MNALCFHNNGQFDRRAFTMLGLSAKDTEKAIGFFGTGFKYAIATLLRNGLSVRICHDDRVYEFHTAPAHFRNKEYTSIYCSDGIGEDDYFELPFTTHLGANWKLWQAYRELFTNAFDEGGDVVVTNLTSGTSYGDVCVYVYGNGIEDLLTINEQHDKYFLSELTIREGARMRIVPKKHDSDNVVYYKTMYTGTRLDKQTYFTYDYVTTEQLTEDRTLADTWYIRTHIGEFWVHDMSYELLIQHLPEVSDTNYFESRLEVGYNPPSTDFIQACAYLVKHHKPMPMWARELYIRQLPFNEQVANFKPTKYQMKQLKKAVSILHHHKCMIDMDALVLCVSLPNGLMGYYRDSVIYISKQAFERGFECLLGTLYEEHLHMYEGCDDFTRKMQNALVDRIAALMIQVYDTETEE